MMGYHESERDLVHSRLEFFYLQILRLKFLSR